MNKDIEIVVVTFKYDLPQFYLLLLSIKKYLDKDIKIKIFFNYDNQDEYESFLEVKSLVKKHLSEFSVEIIERPQGIVLYGWWSQMILKYYAAYTSDRPWQMVMDSKNFFIRKFNFSDIDFSNNNVPGFFIEKENDIIDDGLSTFDWTVEEIEKCLDFFGEHQKIYPQKIAPVTPWIWKTSVLKEMLDTFWPNCSWLELDKLPSIDWYLYLTWSAGEVHYFPKQTVTGAWGDGTLVDRSYNQLSDEDICFWVKHRFAIDDQTIDVTKKVLKEFNIATEQEIEVWLKMIESVGVLSKIHKYI
jgi:hypothetical protein